MTYEINPDCSTTKYMEDLYLERLRSRLVDLDLSHIKNRLLSADKGGRGHSKHDLWKGLYGVCGKRPDVVIINDFLEVDSNDQQDTKPVSMAPKLNQVQRAKLKAKRKLNRQNRKKARK